MTRRNSSRLQYRICATAALRRFVSLCFLASIGLLLSSCQSPRAAPSGLAESRATAQPSQTLQPTYTAYPTYTPYPSFTPIPTKAEPTDTLTATSYPTFTATPVPTATAVRTATATVVQATATPIPSLMPTPTMTLPPGTTQVEKGLMGALLAIAEGYMPAGADTCELLYHTIVGEIRLVGTQDEPVSQLVTINYPLTFVWSEKSALRDCVFSFQETAPQLFSLDPYLDELKFVYRATVLDQYGAESTEIMLWIQISREQADKIVWANLSQCNIPLVVEVFRLHPSLSLQQAWAELCPSRGG